MSRSNPSLAELRAVCQPPEVMARYSAEHWAGRLYMRKLSLWLTWLAVRTPVSANVMTGGMALFGLAGAAAFSQPGLTWAVAGALLMQIYLWVDCSDGEVARWRGTTSPVGIYLDRLGHYVVEAALFVALGLRAGAWDRGPWAILGLGIALIHVLGKVETDLVEVSRAKYGLPPVRDTADAAAPRRSALARLRRIAGTLPVYRLTGAVEASIVLLGFAVADRIRGDLVATRGLAIAMLGVAVYVVVGHLAMILASSRLRP